jgi:hypothetical protein
VTITRPWPARLRAFAVVLAVSGTVLAGCAAGTPTGQSPQTGAPTSGGIQTPSGHASAPTGPVAGVAIALGKPAIVISPCPGDVVTEVGAYAKESTDITKNVWLAKSANGRRLAVIGVGETPQGYQTVVPYAKAAAPDALSGKVIVKPASGKSFTVSTVDSFADATDTRILVNGNYLSFADFMTQYSLCKVK